MTATIVNAAPMTIFNGIQDDSARQVAVVPEVLPTHLPKVYLYTQKGPLDPQLVVGASATQMYGAASFDDTQPYSTHATVLWNVVNDQANSTMVQRLQPADAPPPATIRVYMDVLATTVPNYTRNSDGSIQVDNQGNKLFSGTAIAGYQVKFVAEAIPVVSGVSTFGQATQMVGDQTNSQSQQSQRYPFFDAVISSFGEWGNNQALAMWAPTSVTNPPIDPALLSQFAYPIRMACLNRADALSTTQVTPTLFASQYVDCGLKPGLINTAVGAPSYAGDVFLKAYQNLTNPEAPLQYGPFSQFKLYDAEILTCLNLFYAAEQPHISSNPFTDFTGATNEQYRFNILSGVSSSNVPYYSYQVVTGSGNSTVFTQNSALFAQGGGDGTMNETLFAGLVTTAIADYADPNSQMQDMARYPESIFYDSGFPVATKDALTAFIAQRPDTFLVLSTHDTSSPQLTAAQESSLALSLLTRCQMYPESSLYGTQCVRALIMGRSGDCLVAPNYPNPLPLTIELASKAAAYMGAGDGKWKAGYNFDMAPLSQIQLFINVNVTFTPASVRNIDWANGLNWVDSFRRRSLYFPALKTVYANDTSVLTSFFTAMCAVELEKVGDRCRRQFSGESILTDSQLIERANQFVEDNTTGRFDGRFTIVPDAVITASDAQRGYSWTMDIKLYAANMKTPMTLSIQSYRIEDLTTTTK